MNEQAVQESVRPYKIIFTVVYIRATYRSRNPVGRHFYWWYVQMCSKPTTKGVKIKICIDTMYVRNIPYMCHYKYIDLSYFLVI
jgi:hypothetical protein